MARLTGSEKRHRRKTVKAASARRTKPRPMERDAYGQTQRN
jgi:hypothetical protein